MTDTGEDTRGGERIAKLLARAGVASRREIERMIAEGRIAKHGVAIDTPATVLRTLAGVTVDGQPVAAPEATRLFLFNKPTGLLVTEHDPMGRPTIYDKLPDDLPRVVPVGRLDINTEGLLLLTTDGEFKRELELPSTGVERNYRARAYGDITQAQLEDLSEGVEIEGVRYASIDANIERRTGANVWIEMTLTEGKNREVRNVLEYLGLQVSRLIRTRYGPFILGDMPPGAIGEVKQHDLVAFRKTLKGRGRNDAMELVSAEPGKVARGAPRDGFRAPPSTDRAAGTRTAPATDAAQARPGFRTAATTDRAARARRPEADRAERTRRDGDGAPWGERAGSRPARGQALARDGAAQPTGGRSGFRSATSERETRPARDGAAPSAGGRSGFRAGRGLRGDDDAGGTTGGRTGFRPATGRTNPTAGDRTSRPRRADGDRPERPVRDRGDGHPQRGAAAERPRTGLGAAGDRNARPRHADGDRPERPVRDRGEGRPQRGAVAERPRTGFGAGSAGDRSARPRRTTPSASRPDRAGADRGASSGGWTPDATPAATPVREDNRSGRRPAPARGGSFGGDRSGPRPTGGGRRPDGGRPPRPGGGRKPGPGGRR